MEHLHDFIEFLRETQRTEDVKNNKLSIDLVERGDRVIFILT